MSDLVAFLAARLDEDEQRALAMKHFTVHEQPYYSCAASRTGPLGDLEWGEEFCDCFVAERKARALREVEAKRKILAAHGPDLINRFGSARSPLCLVCLTDREGYEEQWEADPWPCLTLRALAAVYSDHPDYWPAAAGKDGKE